MNRMYVFILLVAGLVFSANASVKSEADKAYQDNDFKGAIEKYEAIISGGQESADIYYNLGNSYYKDKNIAKAVLNYERALLLSPGDDDIRYNLEMAKSKTIDKVTPKSEIFIVTWINTIRNLMSESSWSVFAISCFILFILATAAYIFGSKIVVKKLGFSAAVIFLILTVVANLFADAQKDKLINRNGAIVMQSSVTVKSTPDESGTDLFVLHEGTKVYINDNSMKGWKEVSLEDGTRGWVPTESIEVI
ncbi:MAG: tetratricopeptide repeat protein [Candidatus Phocaeicola faecipullorum]|nr:tetratricopeptide repeat protein [Candidatus Phocaeicola faecipullorum]